MVGRWNTPSEFNEFKIQDFLFGYGAGLRFSIPQFPIRLYMVKRFEVNDSGDVKMKSVLYSAILWGWTSYSRSGMKYSTSRRFSIMWNKLNVRIFLVLLFVFSSSFAWAQQLTTVGIVDIGKVTLAFYRDSQAVRELEEMTKRLQSELDAITAEINQLKDRQLVADRMGNRTLSLQLEEQISSKTNYLREYYRIKNAQLQERRNKLTESSAFLGELQQAIAFVAEDQGYSVILKSTDPNLIWWSKQVDITDIVIQRLLQTAKR
jgi:outer membrane protein